jgi:DNA primase
VFGHALYPEAIGDHVEALATLPIADRAAASLRDRMVDLTMSGQMLDRQGIATILASKETAAAWRDVSKGGDIGFSFTRTKSDPAIARRDLGLAIDALLTKVEIEAAFATAMTRFKAGDETAFAEQQRLHAAREAINERLASLAGNE